MAHLHIDREYESQLQEVRKHLLAMAGLVDTMIASALKCLLDGDVALARRTIDDDHKVNRHEVETDELCLRILARRQPVASDLRFVTLALKMVTDLERIGDLAVNICERAIDLAGAEPVKPWEDIPRMATIVRGMIEDAIKAFVASDADSAQRVIERDREIDALYVKFFRSILEIMVKDPSKIERGIHLQSVAKWLERMGDHAINLAELVVFMVRGKDIRHLGSMHDE